MRLNKKLKAYTISEMIIVLILTSIVVGLAFSVLKMVQKHMIAIQYNYTRSNELKQLETALWLDFNRYSLVTTGSSEDTLNFSTELDSISYRFTDNSIIREQDTFNVVFQTKQFYFNGELADNKKLDAIKLETSMEFENQFLFIFKSNDANTFMN